jgi:hypothetical protein
MLITMIVLACLVGLAVGTAGGLGAGAWYSQQKLLLGLPTLSELADPGPVNYWNPLTVTGTAMGAAMGFVAALGWCLFMLHASERYLNPATALRSTVILAAEGLAMCFGVALAGGVLLNGALTAITALRGGGPPFTVTWKNGLFLAASSGVLVGLLAGPAWWGLLLLLRRPQNQNHVSDSPSPSEDNHV